MEGMVSKPTSVIQKSALYAGRHREQNNEKLKRKTKNMLKRKIERGIPRTNIVYAEIVKTVRKLEREMTSGFNTIRVQGAVETGKDLGKTTYKEGCTVMILSLKEEDGNNREQIF